MLVTKNLIFEIFMLSDKRDRKLIIFKKKRVVFVFVSDTRCCLLCEAKNHKHTILGTAVGAIPMMIE